jgi:hypothetical protein
MNVDEAIDAIATITYKERPEANKLHQSMQKTFSECLDLSLSKNADYAGNEDPFANFRASTRIGVRMSQGVMIRLEDKFARLERWMSGHEFSVQDEGIYDTIKDAINYLGILKATLEEERTSR